MLKKKIISLLFQPPYIKHCSQTIYQALLGAIKMYEATNNPTWKGRAGDLLDILEQIQQPDGGFDIGYEFDFGLLHKTGMSTSPELVGLLAAVEYNRVFGGTKSEKIASNAANWIRMNYVEIGESCGAVPYSPYNTKEIMVYNGTSFAAGGLGAYLGHFNPEDPELVKIYYNMVNYLNKSMTNSNTGRFWYYYEQSRSDLKLGYEHKIDYYHQMQQAEMHMYANLYSPCKNQMEMIVDACKHVLTLKINNKFVPYANEDKFFGGNIHLWGVASVVAGFLKYYQISGEVIYLEESKCLANNIIEAAWSGEYFYPILNKSGDTPIVNAYMVRSDAWVFNALAGLYAEDTTNVQLCDILEKCFSKMEYNDFSGVESHASNKRTRLISSVINKLR